MPADLHSRRSVPDCPGSISSIHSTTNASRCAFSIVQIYADEAKSRWPALIVPMNRDDTHFVFYKFYKERLPVTDSLLDYVWDFSSDDTRIAILKYSEGRIHLLPLGGKAPHEIVVKGWNSLQSMNWTADERGFFVSSVSKVGSALLHVDFEGNANILWEQQGNIAPWNGPYNQWLGGPSAPWAVPSADGHHLAIYGWSLSANMWMMENF